MKAKVTVLGCGNSTGVPSIGNNWGVCDPNEPRNHRMRSSIMVESDTTKIVVDTGPDFHWQLNRTDVSIIDAVLFTHQHSDHVNGIDELRANTFRRKKLTPIYGNKETLDDLKRRWDHMFNGGAIELYPPLLEPIEITPSMYQKPFQLGDMSIIPHELDHTSCRPLGYRFGDFAYSVDMVRMEQPSIDALKGIKTWMVDAAGYKKTDYIVHADLKTIYKLNEQIGAEQVILTSLALDMDYKTLCDELPDGYVPAHDMMTFEINL